MEIARSLLAQGKAAEAVREFELVHAGRAETLGAEASGTATAARLLAEARQALAASADETPAPAPAPPASGEGTAE